MTPYRFVIWFVVVCVADREVATSQQHRGNSRARVTRVPICARRPPSCMEAAGFPSFPAVSDCIQRVCGTGTAQRVAGQGDFSPRLLDISAPGHSDGCARSASRMSCVDELSGRKCRYDSRKRVDVRDHRLTGILNRHDDGPARSALTAAGERQIHRNINGRMR